MPEYVLPSIGLLAAGLTSLAYIPQLYKAWPRGATGDISLNMLIVLWLGLLLWVVYGLLKPDWVVVLANSIALALVGAVLGCKIRDLRGAEDAA
ncbi:MtN3 and saliva related transmembrane protein [Nitrobacteraceae bacterium AZCC 1564]